MADPSTDAPQAAADGPAPVNRHGRALAIGGLTLAVVLGVAFGQVTGSLSDTATGARDVGPGARTTAPGPGSGSEVPAPPSSLPPSSLSATGTSAPLRAAAAQPTTTTTTTTTVPPASGRAAGERGEGDGAGYVVPRGVRLGPGWRGAAVRELQERLAELGYWLGEPDGTYGEPTRQAVLAFQKAEGLDARDGLADTEVGRRLAAASFDWGRSRIGTVVEIDRDRQLLMVVEDGAVRWTLNAATGLLPRGRYTVEREIDGHYDAPAGAIHRPKYFDGPVAIQGTGPAPAPPAQGCGCVSDAAMDFLWSTGTIRVGTPVLVY